MGKVSAGLLPFRITSQNVIEVFIVHPGGPFWSKKDDGAWSVAKGELEIGENPEVVAEREFAEEVGVEAPNGNRVDLGEIRQPSGKTVRVWAVESAIFEISEVASNRFEMEWPPKSGHMESFPEVDRAEWYQVSQARLKLLKGQVGFLDRLVEMLASGDKSVREGDDSSGQGLLF